MSWLTDAAAKLASKILYKPVQTTAYFKQATAAPKTSTSTKSSSQMSSIPGQYNQISKTVNAPAKTTTSSSKSSKKTSNPIATPVYADYSGAVSTPSPAPYVPTKIGFKGLGNWGLPEFGLSESALGNALSNFLFGHNSNQNSVASAPTNRETLTSYLSNYVAPASGSIATPMSLSASEPAPSGGTDTGGGTPAPTGDLGGTGTGVAMPTDIPTTGGAVPTSKEVFGALYDAASDEEKAQLQTIMNQYDQQAALLNNQLGYAATQRQNSLNTYGTQMQDVASQIAQSRANAQKDVETGTQTAMDTAQQVQRSNRGVLRALGILGSSAAGEMLSKPYNEANKQVATMQQTLIDRNKELDDLSVQKQSEFANNVKSLEDNYAKMVSDIQVDQRYTEAQKIAAAQQLVSAAQTRYAELQQSQVQWEQALAAQKQQYALDLAKIQAYAGISPSTSGISNTNLATTLYGGANGATAAGGGAGSSW